MFENVCAQLSLLEKHFFGLCYVDERKHSSLQKVFHKQKVFNNEQVFHKHRIFNKEKVFHKQKVFHNEQVFVS